MQALAKENKRLLNENAQLYNKIGAERQNFRRKISTLNSQHELERIRWENKSSTEKTEILSHETEIFEINNADLVEIGLSSPSSKVLKMSGSKSPHEISTSPIILEKKATPKSSIVESNENSKENASGLKVSKSALLIQNGRSRPDFLIRSKSTHLTKNDLPINNVESKRIERSETFSDNMSSPERQNHANQSEFLYQETTRSKADRKQMHGVSCPCCKDYYNYTKKVLPIKQLGQDETESRKQVISRHRVWSKRPPTPPGYFLGLF